MDEPDHLRCSPRATRNDAHLNLVSVDHGPEPRGSRPVREKPADLAFNRRRRLRWHPYRGSDRHYDRPAIGHKPLDGGPQAGDQSKRDLVEPQSRLDDTSTARGSRAQGHDIEGDLSPSDGDNRIGQLRAASHSRREALGHGLDRGPFSSPAQFPLPSSTLPQRTRAAASHLHVAPHAVFLSAGLHEDPCPQARVKLFSEALPKRITRMRPMIKLALALAGAAFAQHPAAVGETLRCGAVLIQPGDDCRYVLEKCGDPDSGPTLAEPAQSPRRR